MSDGVKLIAAERDRQISEEGWTAEHDDEHVDGSMALAAACYAAPQPLFLQDRRYVNRVVYEDAWPWEGKWDKRFSYGTCRDNPGNVLPDPDSYSAEERVDLLVKAGALIAAELDRLLRARNR